MTAFLLLPIWLLTQAQDTTSTEQPIVARVDHVIIQTTDAQAFFAFLTDELDLPVAWPLRSYGHFTSGGVFAGNVNVEVLLKPNGDERNRARLAGIAFEPAESASASVDLLAIRKLLHGPILPIWGFEDGKRQHLWSSVFLYETGVQDSMVLVCDYAWDVAERRLPLRRELSRRKGGSLGLVEVQTVFLGVSDFEKHRLDWESLLTPHPRNGDVWSCGDGPLISLVPHDDAHAMSLSIKVASKKKVREFAKAHNDIDHSERDGEMWL